MMPFLRKFIASILSFFSFFVFVKTPEAKAQGYGPIMEGKIYPRFYLMKIVGPDSKNKNVFIRSEDILEPFALMYSPRGKLLNKPIKPRPITKYQPQKTKRIFLVPQGLKPPKPVAQNKH